MARTEIEPGTGGFETGSLCADFTNAYCARALPTGARATPSSLTNARGLTFLSSPRAGKSTSPPVFNVDGSILFSRSSRVFGATLLRVVHRANQLVAPQLGLAEVLELVESLGGEFRPSVER